MIYNKNKDGKEKNNIQKNILSALEDRKLELIDNNKGTLALVISESITNIKRKQMETNNKMRGQNIRYLNREINGLNDNVNNLTDKVNILGNKLNYYEPEENEWIELNVHPFSHNYMNKPVKDYYGVPKIVKNEVYTTWQNKFPYKQLPSFEELGIDFSKRVCVWFRFIAKEVFDCTNLHKSVIDTICNYYEVDDKTVELMECSKIGTCKEYSKWEIYVALRNQ